MIAVDTNILVYAHRKDSEFHAPAAELIRTLAEGMHAWSIAWPRLIRREVGLLSFIWGVSLPSKIEATTLAVSR